MELSHTYGRGGYEGKQDITTTSTGAAADYIMIPSDAEAITVQLHVDSTAVVVVEGTASVRADVVAGTAEWTEWGAGDVTNGSTVQDSPIGKLTAVRANVQTGKAGVNAYLSVIAQRSTP